MQERPCACPDVADSAAAVATAAVTLLCHCTEASTVQPCTHISHVQVPARNYAQCKQLQLSQRVGPRQAPMPIVWPHQPRPGQLR
jgi:hypothetical protein